MSSLPSAPASSIAAPIVWPISKVLRRCQKRRLRCLGPERGSIQAGARAAAKAPIEQARAAWYPANPGSPPLPTMPDPHRRRRGPKPDRRRALELLAASPDGCTEALMFANGFTAELLVELVRAGLAPAHAERMVAGGKMTEVARVKISEAGWQALGDDAINGRAKST
jgi:hypothetical protein